MRPLWERHRAGLEAGRTAFEPVAHSRDVVVVPIRPHGALRALLCVEVDEQGWNRLGRIESFAQVHHLVSTVTGRLRAGLDAFDLLHACFPANRELDT